MPNGQVLSLPRYVPRGGGGSGGGCSFGPYSLVQFKAHGAVGTSGTATLPQVATPGNLMVTAIANNQTSGVSAVAGGMGPSTILADLVTGGNNHSFELRIATISNSPTNVINWWGNGDNTMVAAEFAHNDTIDTSPMATWRNTQGNTNSQAYAALANALIGGILIGAVGLRGSLINGFANNGFTYIGGASYGNSRCYMYWKEHTVDPAPGGTITSSSTSGISGGQYLIR